MPDTGIFGKLKKDNEEKMKILVLGSKGMLGYAVTNYFEKSGNEVEKLSRNEFDIAKDPIENLITFVDENDIVINCVGVIKPRIAQMPIEDVLRVNTIFPQNLAKMCEKLNKKLIHITTDCVYTGNKGKYDENDFFDADDVYGMTKNGGEPRNCMTLRTSIIGEEIGEGRSLLAWVKKQAGKEANGYLNHWWNGVTTLYLAEIIDNILKNNLYEKGLFHIHSPNTLDKYQLVSAINRTYDLNIKVNPVKVEISCDRSMKSIYKLSGKLCTKTIKEQLFEMREFFDKL